MIMGLFLFLVLAGGIGIWTYGSVRILRHVEEARYTVALFCDGYEIREYPEAVMAEVTLSGDFDTVGNEGFSILSGYIFGENETKMKLAMTAPVGERLPDAAGLSPASHVTDAAGRHTVMFMMPQAQAFSSLPRPDDSRIVFGRVPRRSVAALRFGWYPTAKRVAEKEQELLRLLERDGRTVFGEAELARYNPPFAMPFILRNEILIEVE